MNTPNKLKNNYNHSELVNQIFKESINIKTQLVNTEQLKVLVTMAEIIANSIKNNGKLLLCGNGGSAADAQHLAAELLVRLRSQVNRRSIPAISLAMDPSTMTAIGNDYGFNDLFSRPLAGIGRSGDVLLGITTSGKSQNVLAAFELAKSIGVKTLGFLGEAGSPAENLCDLIFTVPSKITARIQEIHITAGHVVMELVENILIGIHVN